MIHRHAIAALLVLALLPPRARADASSEARLREALRTATSQLRALEDEKVVWQAKQASMQKEIDALRAQASAASRAGAGSKDLRELRQRLAAAGEAAERSTASLARCEGERADAASALEEERKKSSAASAELSDRLRASEARSEKLYQVGHSIIDWLSKVGVAGAIAAREPFLGLKRVELENAAQDWDDRLREARSPASASR